MEENSMFYRHENTILKAAIESYKKIIAAHEEMEDFLKIECSELRKEINKLKKQENTSHTHMRKRGMFVENKDN